MSSLCCDVTLGGRWWWWWWWSCDAALVKVRGKGGTQTQTRGLHTPPHTSLQPSSTLENTIMSISRKNWSALSTWVDFNLHLSVYIAMVLRFLTGCRSRCRRQLCYERIPIHLKYIQYNYFAGFLHFFNSFTVISENKTNMLRL